MIIQCFKQLGCSHRFCLNSYAQYHMCPSNRTRVPHFPRYSVTFAALDILVIQVEPKASQIRLLINFVAIFGTPGLTIRKQF